MNMEAFPLNLVEFRYLKKHRINLETRFHLKIILPEKFNQTCTLATVYGDKQNLQELKNLLKEKVGENNENQSTSNSVPLITLSDTDSEIQSGQETPKKKKKKRKFKSLNCSTPSSAGGEATEGNSSEIQALDETAPDSKRMRSKTASPEEYIPLAVTTKINRVRSVKRKRKNKYAKTQEPLNATNQKQSIFLTDSFLPWPSRTKVSATTSCSNSNPSSVKCTSLISVSSTAPCETDTTSTQDDSVRIMEDNVRITDDSIRIIDIFVLDNKPSTSIATASSIGPCDIGASCTLDDSVKIIEDSDRITDDSIRIIDDSFVLENKPSLPNENDTSTIVLDDSIIEIPMPESKNQLTSQSNSVAQLSQMWNNPPTNRNCIIKNGSQHLANLSNDTENYIPLTSRTVLPPKWENAGQQYIASNHNLRNGGLQNGATSFSFPMPNGLALQVPRPMTVKLRPVVIDGSNVARLHGTANKTYSCRGINICVDFFLKRGHTEVTVFIPRFRKHQTHGKFPTTDAHLLEELEKTGHIAYAPSRIVDGKALNCHDDRFIVQLATDTGGVIVSNDNFRDIMVESEAYKKTIKERLLMFLFAGDKIMFPDDPLGRDGPRLKEFLEFPPEEV